MGAEKNIYRTAAEYSLNLVRHKPTNKEHQAQKT